MLTKVSFKQKYTENKDMFQPVKKHVTTGACISPQSDRSKFINAVFIVASRIVTAMNNEKPLCVIVKSIQYNSDIHFHVFS